MLRNAAGRLLVASLTVSFAAAGAFAARAAAQQSPQPSAQSAKVKAAPAPGLEAQPQPNQKTFKSPEEAASALYSAARNNDENMMMVILGPDAREIVMWTDNAEDRKADADQFSRKYEQMHRLVREPDGETTLYIGPENWPLPIPIVEAQGAWYFATALGKQEILYRRIGENELETIDALHAIVNAQKEYYSKAAAGDGAHVYTARLDSDGGSHDGLYWSSPANDSPIGPFTARASYDRPDHVPLHGYFFRMLTAQGAGAPGGAKSYLSNGKMAAGFAVVAFPAEYRQSGVKTFIVDQDGKVYERDLGPMTTQIAAAMKDYNPTAAWHKAP